MTEESQQSIECKAAIRAALEKVGEYCGLEGMGKPEKVGTCRESLRATISSICDCCGTERPKLNMLSMLPDLAEVIDDPDMFKDALDKLSPTGAVRTGANVELCRESLRATISAICDYCGTERPNLKMLSKLPDIAEIIDDPDMFKDELDNMCSQR